MNQQRAFPSNGDGQVAGPSNHIPRKKGSLPIKKVCKCLTCKSKDVQVNPLLEEGERSEWHQKIANLCFFIGVPLESIPEFRESVVVPLCSACTFKAGKLWNLQQEGLETIEGIMKVIIHQQMIEAHSSETQSEVETIVLSLEDGVV